jgi:hypothetical protein
VLLAVTRIIIQKRIGVYSTSNLKNNFNLEML